MAKSSRGQGWRDAGAAKAKRGPERSRAAPTAGRPERRRAEGRRFRPSAAVALLAAAVVVGAFALLLARQAIWMAVGATAVFLLFALWELRR